MLLHSKFRRFPCCIHCCRVVNGPHFEAQNRPDPAITSPNQVQNQHLFLKPDLGPKAKFTEESRYAQLRSIDGEEN